MAGILRTDCREGEGAALGQASSVEEGGGSDWKDGFLFVGNELSLDFLNTRPMMNGEAVELLSDWAAVVRWLRAASVVSEEQAKGMTAPGRGETAPVLEELRRFRERWRGVLAGREAGLGVERGFVEELNRLLEEHRLAVHVLVSDGALKKVRRFEPRGVEDVMAPVVDSVAHVLTEVDPARVRKCASCELRFHDTSKKGTRRWCSMQICGNRNKVAAYAKRKRGKG